ncbi:MAG TPA: DUF3987 domain-containing protein [Steroidobacteraceae bacterium]|jgi:hypothetical protein|nr:DUF3987 domain-containing protein [Steroidobacteraceae bacterium]
MRSNGADSESVAEQALLGALLIDSSAWEKVATKISASDLHRPDHRLIFEAIAELAGTGRAADVVTVAEQLGQRGKIDDAGGLAYLATLARDTPSAQNIEHYAAAVRQRVAARCLAQVSSIIHDGLRAGEEPAEVIRLTREALDGAESRLDDRGAGWPEPVDFLRELSAPPFTASDLPSPLGAYALGYAQQTGFDPSLCVLPAVGAAAAALDDRYELVADAGTRWQQSARLWTLGIAPSGSGKSPIRQAMLKPLHDLHEQETRHHEAETAGLDPTAARPPRPRVVVADATIEALSEVLRDCPRGVLVAIDEFEAFLGALDQYRRSSASRDRGEWLRLFDGGPHTVERVQRGGVFVPNFGASLQSATTPATLLKLGKLLPEDGLLQRFLIAVGRRQVDGVSVAGMMQLTDDYAETLRRLYHAAPAGRDGRVYFDEPARAEFTRWLREQRTAQAALDERDPSLGAHLAKYPTFALRLALTFHAAEVVQTSIISERDPAACPVTLESLRTALRFLERCRQHALVLYLSLRNGSPLFDLARDIARAILAMGRPQVERRDLQRNVVAFRKADEREQAQSIDLLIDLGWLRPATDGYRKAHATRFAVNPRIAERFAQLAAAERERRAAVRELIAEAAQERRA